MFYEGFRVLYSWHYFYLFHDRSRQNCLCVCPKHMWSDIMLFLGNRHKLGIVLYLCIQSTIRIQFLSVKNSQLSKLVYVDVSFPVSTYEIRLTLTVTNTPEIQSLGCGKERKEKTAIRLQVFVYFFCIIISCSATHVQSWP